MKKQEKRKKHYKTQSKIRLPKKGSHMIKRGGSIRSRSSSRRNECRIMRSLRSGVGGQRVLVFDPLFEPLPFED